MTESRADSAPMQIHYQNTLEDWEALQRSFSAGQRWRGRWGLPLVAVGFAVACGLPGTLVLLVMGQPSALAIGWGLLLLLAASVVCFAIKRQTLDEKILRPTTLTLHGDYVEVQGDRGWERRDWSLVARVQPTEELIILHRDDGLVFAIPRRAFATPTAAEAFCEAAQQLHERAKQRVGGIPPAPVSWQEAATPAMAFASDTLQVTYSTAAAELQELQAGMILQPVDEQPPAKPSRPVAIFPWLLLGAVAVGTFLLLPRDDGFRPGVAVSVVAFVLLSILAVWPVFRMLQFFLMRGQKPPPEVTQTLTISPLGVALWAPRLEARTAWEAIDAVQANERVIAFVANRPSPVYLYAIPKSAFADEYAARHFAETAARYRRAAAERLEEQDLAAAPRVETGNPYQPPQAQ